MLLRLSTLQNAGDEWCVIIRCKLARNMKCVAGWVLRRSRAVCKNPPSKASRFACIIPTVSECYVVTSHRLPHRRPACMAIATDPLNSSAERSQTSSGFGKKEPTKLMPRTRTVSNCLRGECCHCDILYNFSLNLSLMLAVSPTSALCRLA